MSVRKPAYVIIGPRRDPVFDAAGWERRQVLDAIVRAGAAGLTQEGLAALVFCAWSKTPGFHATELQKQGLVVLKEGRWYPTSTATGSAS